MFEIEKKYRLPAACRAALEAQLIARYGEPECRREEDLHGFTSPNKQYLRLRTSGDAVWLIAKGPTVLSADGIRTRPEVEMPLSAAQYDTARALVQVLFAEPLPTMRRERRVWQIDAEAEIVLDLLDDLPDQPFVELEVLDRDSEAAQARLRQLEADLGLQSSWQEVRSYAQILAELA